MKPIRLRMIEERDWPAVVNLHVEQQQRQGTCYELPYLFGPSIALALVGVDSAGEIRGCLYAERVAELRFVGCDPRMTAWAEQEISGFTYLLKRMGYRWLECFVPRKFLRAIGRPLQRVGFAHVDDELSHFTLDMRERE